MSPRFEVVSAPIEERFHASFQDQTAMAVQTIVTLINFVSDKKSGAVNTTMSMIRDEEFVHRVTLASIDLVKPTSLPGFLLLFAVFIRLVHWVALSLTCHKALTRATLNVKNGKVD